MIDSWAPSPSPPSLASSPRFIISLLLLPRLDLVLTFTRAPWAATHQKKTNLRRGGTMRLRMKFDGEGGKRGE